MMATLQRCEFAPVPGASALAGGVLHPWEWRRLGQLRDARRRDTFVAGRVAAKRLLTALTSAAPAELAIVSWNCRGAAAAPLIWRNGRLFPGRLSIAHDDTRAVAAWSDATERILGVDLSDPQTQLAPSPLYFGPEERQQLARLPNPQRRKTAARWFAAKEAAFKTLGSGRFEPRRFAVRERDRCRGPSNVGTFQITQQHSGKTHASLLTIAERDPSPLTSHSLLILTLQTAAEPTHPVKNGPHHD
jgi:4'-phosphopantetheinyl transferase EntD